MRRGCCHAGLSNFGGKASKTSLWTLLKQQQQQQKTLATNSNFLKHSANKSVHRPPVCDIYSGCSGAVPWRDSIPGWQLWPVGIVQTEEQGWRQKWFMTEETQTRHSHFLSEVQASMGVLTHKYLGRLYIVLCVFRPDYADTKGEGGSWFSMWFVSSIELGDNRW